MKTYSKQPETKSDTAQPKASKQASAHYVLQAYKDKIAQRQEIDEDELLQGKFGDAVQREEFDEDELLQGKFDTAQREGIDEDELLQGKFDASSTARREEATQQPPTENVTGMSDNLKSGIESLSGYSMDDVRVHYNSSKPAQLQALAYAQGTDIHVAPGQEQHLPHEAWHVVQQKQGRVQPTTQLQGVNVNDNEVLENEADAMGRRAEFMKQKSESGLIKGNINQTTQLTPMDVEIVGITHLVKIKEGSIFEGEEEIEVEEGDKITIEPEESIWSRRGPNQEDEIKRSADEAGAQIYEWYLVLGIEGSYYLRDETFIVPNEINIVGDTIESKITEAKERATIAPIKKNAKIKWEGMDLNARKLLFMQNLGIIFELAASDYIHKKHTGYTIFESLKEGNSELDFVVLQGTDLIIYSAKLNPKEFAPKKDLQHWSNIKNKNKEVLDYKHNNLKGADFNMPLVLLLSPETFGMTSSSFQKFIWSSIDSDISSTIKSK